MLPIGIDGIAFSVAQNPSGSGDGDIYWDDILDKPPIPTKTSELENDSGFLTQHQSLEGYAKKEDIPTDYVKPSDISLHNTSSSSHNDIRLLIEGLTTRLNALANSDDTTLDQMAEVVAYIKNNKSLIDSITTSKVNVSDIIDDLKTSVSNKPLSAKQGVQLKALIDGIFVPTKVSQLTNDSGFLTKHQSLEEYYKKTETYSQSEVDNKVTQLLQKIVNLNVPTKTSELENNSGFLTEIPSEYITDEELAHELAKRGQLQPSYANSIEECTDTTKIYVLPDGFLYAYMTVTEETSGANYTNVLPLAINSDGTPYVGLNGEKGYKKGWRINSSDVEKEAENRSCTGFIPMIPNCIILLKDIYHPTDGNMNGYITFYNSNFVKIGRGYENVAFKITNGECEIDTTTCPLSVGDVNRNSFAYFRLSTGTIDETSIITINEEIKESTTTTTTSKWVNTGLAFVPANYENRIVDLEANVSQNTKEIEALKKGVNTEIAINPLDYIRNWDSPIYDKQEVFLLSTDKESASGYAKTPSDIYAKYDELMNDYPNFITKTDLGLCSDGVNHVYRYDFKESEPHHQSGFTWSETKPKAIIISGIHYEWGGIYALYHALYEITTNPNLSELRRNVHLIVIPCCNPYSTIASNYQNGLSTPNSQGVKNANGVEIHRNFEVDHVVIDSSNLHYGGAAPLTEVETQYIDNVFKENTDSAFFMSCHSCQTDDTWGTNVIWYSSATKYMSNMGFRMIDKLSKAWIDKYGDTLKNSIEANKTDLLESGDYRLGWSQLSNTAGSEQKQATKYGIQAFNLEITDTMTVFESTSLSASTMSRGAEVYVNALLTAFGNYDFKDKKEYSI